MKATGIYSPEYEHDACGVGFVVNIDGKKSHDIVTRGIDVLVNLEHRGATGEDANTGDGAGVLLQIPDTFLRAKCAEDKIDLPEEGEYGVGVIFLPSDKNEADPCRNVIQKSVDEEGFKVIGWREVPVDPSAIGDSARESMPEILQLFVSADGLSGDELERKLFVLRKRIENSIESDYDFDDRFYIVSMSSRTLIYKGLMLGTQVTDFYPDLSDESMVSAFALVHQRYSTNTFPSWKLAQPFRCLAHNGEINTLRGNKNQMRSRETHLSSDLFGSDIQKIVPVIDETGSDSACLDNMLEFLTIAGRDIPHSTMMLVPQAWGEKYPIGPDLKGFFEYHAGIMEPWDGPAAVAFSDGKVLGALLDRNGLRPCRYTISKDGFMVLSSETGVLDFEAADIAERGALRPGQIIVVDLEEGRVKKDKEIKTYYARKQPYRRWVEENKVSLRGLFGDVTPVQPDDDTLLKRQKLFGYTREDMDLIFDNMASTGKEPVGAMGHDVPLAVFSQQPQLLYNYFKQMFAQITNPAIDPIREELVMSLTTFMGNTGNILSEVPQNARLLKLTQPILSCDDISIMREMTQAEFQSVTIDMGFEVTGKSKAMKKALDSICSSAESAVRDGHSIIILSDRYLKEEIVPIPALLAVSAVNSHLVAEGLRTSAAIIVETGEAREVQHFALLLGYGATAINPYLAFETIGSMVANKQFKQAVSPARAIENYIEACCKGLRKIMSKMGISTLRSYRCAQVFESIGLKAEVVEKYFAGTATRIEGIGLDEIAEEAIHRHRSAFGESIQPSYILPDGGYYRVRNDGERHLWTPEAIATLQQATRNNDEDLYRKYTELINGQSEQHHTLRSMFRFANKKPVPIEEVESVEDIMKRFASSAMSFGSISKEAHETLAIGMNRIGASSNSGEGGEDSARFRPLPNGDSKCSKIKQIASGRFGVTAEYLVNADELQIKIAQGAKPGEGGQLPGHKVNEEIARVRHSTPGVTLISPPPHHDIYSIEDIKQLIFDLRNVNPRSRVAVKLVAEVGVGTIAAGVAKAKADMVLISGYDGGTGASPLSSVKHAGAPWELGLSETQQTLMLNNLRSRIRVQTDGQLKTGRDLAVACLLGAEEFGFATSALVVMGCVMMRKCNENICSVGIATQDPVLRKRFSGKAEYIENFFRFLAQDLREHMAQLGFRTVEEMVGRSDCLEMDDAVDFWKARGLDFSKILYRVAEDVSPRHCVTKQDHSLDTILDRKLVELSKESLEDGKPVEIDLPIKNTDLTTGAMLSGEIAKKYGEEGLPDSTIKCRFAGSAGQSFGAFAAKGLEMTLEGDANDYVGKGLSGGRVIVKPPQGVTFDPSENIICGNVLMYGATAGEVYINGCVGERFCIRNSGASAVVEGVGDHACEYMTGGRVVVLGDTGVNFAAGMSGGIAYVYDPDAQLDAHCNLDMVDLEIVRHQSDADELKLLIEQHFKYTGSKKAESILKDWDASLPYFVKVFPMEYRRVLGEMMKEDEVTEREEIPEG